MIQHHPKRGYNAHGQKLHREQPIVKQVISKISIWKIQLCIYTLGTGVEKLWIKNLSCIPWEAFSLLLRQRSWTLQQNCTHTLILTRHVLMSTSKKQEDRSMIIDEGFFLQKGTSKSGIPLTKVLLFSPFPKLRNERSTMLFLVYSLYMLVSS